MKKRKPHLKKPKMCPVCGKDFLGTKKAQTCSGLCRTRLSRMLKDGQKPEYYLIAKSRGQKVPDLSKLKKQ